MGWLLVIVAGVFEVGFTTAMKASENFSRPIPTVMFFLSAGLSFWLLTRAIQYLPLGTAYAVWTGIGAIGTVAVGILIYGEPAGPARMFFLGLLIFSILGLKFVSN
jgi:quaternary ammonium compound-resistance protein SugE